MVNSLFDFEFESSTTEEDIVAAFEHFKQVFKKMGNYHSTSMDRLPFEIRSFVHHFEERKWIQFDGSRLTPRRDLLDYKTAEEVAEEYQNILQEILSRKSYCWYSDILSVRNNIEPFEFSSEEERQRFYELKAEITKETVLTLGLNHFLNVPSSRGMKMNRFSSKWEKKHVIPFIASLVIPITDYDEMKAFFKNNAFFCGRRDWAWEMQTTPYPEFKTIMLTEFDVAALCEAKDEKTVSLILSYTGGSWCNSGSEKYKILYPDGWSYERYQSTLTFDDVDLIFADMERLNRLHRGSRYAHSA